MKTISIVAIAGFVLALAPATQAALVLEEKFDGPGTANIAGSTADSGQTWVATGNTSFKQDGTVGSSKGAYLPFTLTQGLIYTLEVDLTSTRSSRMAAGFSVGARGGGEPPGDPEYQAEIYAWMYVDVAECQAYTGNGYNGTMSWIPGGGVGTWAGDTMTIVLDTSNAADYTVELFDDNGSRSSASIGTPAIDHVFYGTMGGSYSGKFVNLTLSDNSGPVATPGTVNMFK
jgi:hypothetical protein